MLKTSQMLDCLTVFSRLSLADDKNYSILEGFVVLSTVM